ncbi:EamA family transporter [Paeniroseomonas aquatica]|uniref:EamA family transporter n=1 Tax=Paeniroseomonas aquatica TaxID=373043 RepID=UPI003622972B
MLAYAQLSAAMALVGANVAVGKLLAEALPVPLILALRCLLACLVLWPLARLIEGRVRVAPGVLRNLALQALVGTVLYNAGLLAGLRLTTALEAGLVLATLPAVVALGSAAWLRERLSARQWLAACLAAGAWRR